MKKAVLIGALVLSVLAVFACKSQPKSADGDVKDLFSLHYGDLILEGAKTYTVVSGDTLYDIANAEYSNGYYYPIIMLASKDVVYDPDKIFPGMKLIIPNLQRNLNNPKAKANIKQFLLEYSKIRSVRSRSKDAKGIRELSNSL